MDAAIQYGSGKLISVIGGTFKFEHNFVHVGFGS
jgi:hypothetical protein